MQDVYYMFSTAREPGEGETVYTVAMEQLDQYFTPQVNVPYERHLFRTMAQLPTESIDQYITRLRERADYCEFGTARDENIHDQVIEKIMYLQSTAKETPGKRKRTDFKPATRYCKIYGS